MRVLDPRRLRLFPLTALLAVLGTPAWGAVRTTGCVRTDVACTLQELLDGGTIEVGDKRFANWEVERVEPAGVAFDRIDVIGLDDTLPSPGPGLRFVANGQLLVTGTDFLDLRLGFTVQTLDPLRRISGGVLAVQEGTVKGHGWIRVDETIFDRALRALGTIRAEVDPAFGAAERTDRMDVPGESFLFIEKELYLDGWSVDGAAELDLVTQRFLQVPEPRSWIALALASGCLGGLRRRRAPGDRLREGQRGGSRAR